MDPEFKRILARAREKVDNIHGILHRYMMNDEQTWLTIDEAAEIHDEILKLRGILSLGGLPDDRPVQK